MATEETMVVEFRRRTLLPLDDVLGRLRDNLPRLSRSALHRCLVRHGISRLPAGDPVAKRKRFAANNLAKHLKALRWKTPFQTICDAWTKDPSTFKTNPHHLIPGPYT